MNYSRIFKITLGIALLFGCTTDQKKNQTKVQGKATTQSGRNIAAVYNDLGNDERRGSPAQYDPGAPKGSEWARLFGSVPNYRAYGKTILNSIEEKFRWEFGPMWYRGRLGNDQVKVFIVGQEGAQDENITNRAFTGSTGTKTQNFLNHLGIYSSYLFLNTFVYTINGQLEPDNAKFNWMEQGETSPIVEYRHKLFDNMANSNRGKLALIIGVGSGGKASVATWINARGGSCSPAAELKNCDTKKVKEFFKLSSDLVVVGVPHPGGANPNLGGDAAMKNIIGGFTFAAQRVAAYKIKRPDWLPSDADEPLKGDAFLNRLNAPYNYKNAPVPFRDFAFGTNWRMGASGTSSNRWGAGSIQVFSSEGEYAPDKAALKYVDPADVSSNEYKNYVSANNKIMGVEGMSADNFNTNPPVYDVTYEPPRYASTDPSHSDAYDYGPCGDEFGPNNAKNFTSNSDRACSLAEKLTAWPNFSKMSPVPVSHMSFGFAGTYRGRLTKAQVLILADQEGHDDMFSARALTGEVGQRLQNLLNVVGAGSSYAIVRTLPVDTLGMSKADIVTLATNKDVLNTHRALLKEIKNLSGTKVLITMGVGAGAVATELKKDLNMPVFKLSHPNELGDYSDAKSSSFGKWKASHAKQWNETAGDIAKIFKKNIQASYDGRAMTIPREDLPYSSRWWMGTSGFRAARTDSVGKKGHYYRVYSPDWQQGQPSKPLSSEQQQDLSQKMKKEKLL